MNCKCGKSSCNSCNPGYGIPPARAFALPVEDIKNLVELVKCSIPQGPQGVQGIQGERGPRIVDLRYDNVSSGGTNTYFLYEGGEESGPLYIPPGIPGPIGPQGEQGAQGIPGGNGQDGTPGASAYDSWLALGNTGSLADFMASLVGAQGPQGIQGNQGVQGVPGADGMTASNGGVGTTPPALNDPAPTNPAMNPMIGHDGAGTVQWVSYYISSVGWVTQT